VIDFADPAGAHAAVAFGRCFSSTFSVTDFGAAEQDTCASPDTVAPASTGASYNVATVQENCVVVAV